MVFDSLIFITLTVLLFRYESRIEELIKEYPKSAKMAAEYEIYKKKR